MKLENKFGKYVKEPMKELKILIVVKIFPEVRGYPAAT
jgi:hypothetical protein